VLRNVPFDFVVILCDEVGWQHPAIPANARVIPAAFDDPTALARTAATEEEAIEHYRRVRDEIRRFVETLPETLARLLPSPE
jgi:arsenate reductase (thioredoxin)